MRVVVQRVSSASVSVAGKTISSIGPGLVCLIGIKADDVATDTSLISKKILASRVFHDPDTGQGFARSVVDIEGEVLCVSQFTLYGRLKSKKPDFVRAMPSAEARSMYSSFLTELKQAYHYERIKDGEFGAMMEVALVNDGPVTFVIDSDGTIGISS